MVTTFIASSLIHERYQLLFDNIGQGDATFFDRAFPRHDFVRLESVKHVTKLLHLFVIIAGGVTTLEAIKFLVFVVNHRVVDVLEHHLAGAHIVSATAVVGARVLRGLHYLVLLLAWVARHAIMNVEYNPYHHHCEEYVKSRYHLSFISLLKFCL